MCAQNVLRHEVIDKVKWEVNRSSPTNKLRDFMAWSRDVLEDIDYQRALAGNLYEHYTLIFLTASSQHNTFQL